MTERMTIEEFNSLMGVGGTGQRPGRRSSRTERRKHRLAMLVFTKFFEERGFTYKGSWKKGMEITTDLLVSEYPFALSEGRKFRLDFAFPALQVGLEIQGGKWAKRITKDGSVMLLGGAHHSPEGRRRDMEKMNLAIKLGWRVVQAEWDDIADGSTARFIADLLEGGTNG